MDPELFLLEMAESEECHKIMYKRLAIRMLIGLYYAMKPKRGVIDPFMIPFRDFVKEQISANKVDVDELTKYMIENDKSNCALFSATTMFTPKKELTGNNYYAAIAKYKVLTPYVEKVDLDVLALIVVSFVFDNLHPSRIDIREIVSKEEFSYPVNQYKLAKVNGAVFKKDGLIFDGKGYFYNYFTNKAMLDPLDNMVGFARIIHDEAGTCDILYRLDERLSMPESEYYDYTGVAFEKFYGPQFKFDGSSLTELIEDMEELRSERTMLLNSLGCANDAAVKKVKTSVSTMKDTLKNLEAKEVQFTAELDAAQKEFAVLQEQAAYFDSIELYDVRQAIRPDKEQNAVHKLQKRYADKYSHMTMVDGKREVSRILDEYAEGQTIQQMKREQQHRLQQEHQQNQPKKKRDDWER